MINLTINSKQLEGTIQRLKERNIVLPTFEQMKNPMKYTPIKIQNELKVSLDKKSISDNLYKNLCLTFYNIVNIMLYNAGDLFGFWEVESFKKNKDKDQ